MIYSIAVRHRCNGPFIFLKVQHRMVATTMTELQFESFRSTCQCDKLVAQADSENRNFTKQTVDEFGSTFYIFRITGTIGKHHAVRINQEYFFGSNVLRNYSNIAVTLGKLAKDPQLRAEIYQYHLQASTGTCISCFGRYSSYLVGWERGILQALNYCTVICITAHYLSFQNTLTSQNAGKSAGIDS